MYPNGLESLTERVPPNKCTYSRSLCWTDRWAYENNPKAILYRKHDKHIKTTYYNEAKHKY